MGRKWRHAFFPHIKDQKIFDSRTYAGIPTENVRANSPHVMPARKLQPADFELHAQPTERSTVGYQHVINIPDVLSLACDSGKLGIVTMVGKREKGVRGKKSAHY